MTYKRSLQERLLALLLAGATTFSLVPTSALAEAVEGASAAPQAEAGQVVDGDGAEDGGAAGDGEAAGADGVAQGAESAAGDGADSGSGAADFDSNTSDPVNKPQADDVDSTTDASVATGDAGKADAAAASDNASATDAAPLSDAITVADSTSLTENAKVFIHTDKDHYSTYGNKYGALSIGETIYANMYDGSSSYSLSSVANPGTWTYTWLAGTARASSSVSDYTEVVGTEQGLTITEDMAGKYLICKVTADGTDYYGPSVSYGSGINANYIPGPVLAAGQASLYSVKLSSSAPSVGDTVTATAYTDYSTPAGDDVNVTFTWSYADSKYGTYTTIEGETGSTFTVTEACKGKYLKVTANAGVGDVSATTSDAVLAAGAVKLAGVELTASSTEVGATLTAKAYTGSSYSPSYVDSSKVTYTWKKYKGTSAPSSSTTWTTIEDASGPTLTVTADLEGYYVDVVANAGANDAKFGSYSTNYGVGPFKLAGAVDIYSAILAPAGSTSGSYVYTVDDTVCALAKEKGASDFIDADKLSYQWQVADSKNGEFSDIPGATGQELALSPYEGKSVKCVVSSKIGSSTYTTRATNAIAAAGSINVTKVSLDATSKVEAGTKLTATATASGADVTASEKLAWSWYWGDASGSCTNKIDGATTNTFTPDAATYAGKYVQARADGGYGEEKSNAVAVVEKGSVELYGVTVSGARSSGAVQVGATLTAKATKGNSYTYVESTDTVHYQWQYSETKSSSDSAFKNIPGAADSATYVVDDSMVANYIRVIATSENSVKSTQKNYYGSTSTVDPVGPVTFAGQYTLKSVAPAEATTATLTAGTTLTPRVKIPGSSSWSDTDLPEDAKLTLAWYASSDNGATWVELTDGIDAETGALTLGSTLAGKKLKLTACSLDNTVEWLSSGTVAAEGTYDLLRVTTSPQLNESSTTLVTGDIVAAMAQARRVDGSTTNGIDVSGEVDFAWYAVDADTGESTLLTGLTGPSITVPAEAAGKQLKVVATSGTSSVEQASENKVLSADSLAAAVEKLSSANTRLSVAYSADGANVNDVLKAELARLGYTGIDVRVAQDGVAFAAEDSKATVGISDADGDANGDVTFFFMDPNQYTGYNLDGLRSANVVFELSRGDETEYYEPNKTVQIAWDEAKLQELLDQTAADLAVTYASGDTAESVTQNFTLPYRAGSAKKFEVSWKSSDTDHVWVSGYGWGDYTGKVTRASSDRDITLTATVKLLSNVSSVDLSGTEDFTITVKGDPEKVAADKAALQAKVDAAFTYDTVTYSGTSTVADKDGLTADLQMPRPATIDVDGKYYQVSYSADTDDVTFNGYKGTVFQPMPGEAAKSVKITCTVTDKSNPEVTASKTLDYTVAPQDADDLASELALMEAAKASYAAAILNGQDVDAVTSNLHAFQKAYLAADGSLAWAYNTTDASAAGSGIVPVELDGYDDMGTQGWRLFKSSKPGVVSHENLLVTQPEYNTKVTVSAKLSSEKYARYAELYPDNETYAKLANQDVSATFTVTGAAGKDDPNEGKTITVTAKVTGVSASDADGNYTAQTIVPLTEVEIPYDADKTAEDVLDELMKKAGCTDLVVGAWGLTSATMPDGRVLDTTSSEPWSYWSFFVNSGYASVGAPQYYVKNGDCVEFRYVKGDGTQKDTDAPKVNPSAEHPAVDVVWNGFNNGGAGADDEPLTPTNPTKEASWATQMLTDEQKSAGASLSASDPIIIGDKIYLVTGASVWGGKTWNATLNVVDSATGKVEKAVELGSSMDTTCRPICSDGIIVIPLTGGYLQAVSATTLETLWYTEAFTKQNISSLTVSDGYVYINTLDLWGASNTVQNGTVKRINIATGAVAGSASSTDGGYYWAGGVIVNGYYVVGGDLGQVRVYSADLSQLVASISLGSANIRSSLVVHDGFVYAVTRDDGTLHKLSVAADGSIAEVDSVQFAGFSTSTPSFSGNYAFICGATSSTWTAKGLLSVVDLSDMSVQRVTKADGVELIAESKSTPLVVSRNGDTYVYFTCNGASDSEGTWPDNTYGSGGGIYMYKLGDIEAEEVYIPGRGLAQYCMASVVCDAAGNLYYTNDSGNLFCVKSQSHRVVFDSQGGSAVDPQTPADGSALRAPSDPVREGYTFAGWYVDAACTTAWNFSSPVVRDMTLYAKWEKSVSPAPTGGSSDQIALNGNGAGSSAKTGVSLALGSQVGAASEESSESLLAGFVSVTATGVSSGKADGDDMGSASEGARGAGAASEDATASAGLPIWPFIGMAAAVAALIVVLATKRRKEDEA